MRHTIVIEVPEGADENYVERNITSRFVGWIVPTNGLPTDGTATWGRVKVIEYHHEQMTMSEVVDSLAHPAPPEGEA